MQRAKTKPGLTLGFYGSITVLGWLYQLLFMPETKNRTLEEIDILFGQPTSELAKGESQKSVANHERSIASEEEKGLAASWSE